MTRVLASEVWSRLPRDKAKIYVLLMKQDDPRKCTSMKLARFRLASPIYKLSQIPRNSLVLNPIARDLLLPRDRSMAERRGVVAVDCSWERAQNVFARSLRGLSRRLPALLAANPVNYARLYKLSSVEALAGALYIMGHMDQARELLSLFKWGPSFLTLNLEPLESYSAATSSVEVAAAESEFFSGQL